MKLYTIVYFFILSIIFIVDFLRFRQKPKHTVIQKLLFFVPTVFFVLFFSFLKFLGPQISDNKLDFFIMWVNLLFFVVYIPRIIMVLFHQLIVKYKHQSDAFIRVRNLVLGAFFILISVSVLYTSRRIELKNTSLILNTLPASFDGYKIVQLSDIHLGTRPYDKEFYRSMVQLVNAQNADLIVFTGDMVNNFAEEMVGFDSIFNQLKAKDGTYAILGNHDLGDYSKWDNLESKSQNLEQIKVGLLQFGFKLLDNSHAVLKRNADSIVLVGVGHFHKNKKLDLAKLDEATLGLNKSSLKILLSHNPDYWERKVWSDKSIVLTLSGHTHAGQLGVEMLGKIHSPIALIYNHYNGLYKQGDQYLYVSHGLGFIGVPIMLGIRPEINVITLKTN